LTDVPEVGQRAPSFEAVDQNGSLVSLASFLGRPVVLYFYPKDDTPGCTAEACSFRDSMTILTSRGITVLGVSVDSQKSHLGFASKYSLNFTLLSDNKKSILRAYGVESPFGTAKRMTFIIGSDGIVKYVFTNVNTKSHAVDALKKMEELGLA
jgi:thioredoxin-dependent peroxiredoxin